MSLNINHSTTGSAIEEENQEPDIVCKPNFEVDIKSGSKTLSLTCEFVEEESGEGWFNHF